MGIARTVWINLLFLYIFSLPFFGFSLLNVGERGVVRLDWLIGLLIIALFCLESLAGRLPFVSSTASPWMLLYLFSSILSAISILGSTQIGQFVDFSTKWLQIMMVTPLFFVISSLPMGKAELRNCIRLWVMLAFGIAAHSLYQLIGQIFDLPLTSFVLTNPTIAQGGQSARTLFGYIQPTSIFREPSYLGAFLAPCFVLAVVILLSNQGTHYFFRHKWLNWLLLVTLALALILINSQAILIGLFITLVAIFVSGVIRRGRLLRTLLLSLFSILIVGALLRWIGIDFITAFSHRFTFLILNILDPQGTAPVTSFADRSQGIQVGLEVWRTHPLIGVGPGNMAYHTDIRAATNNSWVQLLVEQGIFGVAMLGAVFLSLLVGLAKCFKRHAIDPFWRPLTGAMFFVLVVTIIDGLFTFNWSDPLRVFVLAMANLVMIRATYAPVEVQRTAAL